MKHRILIYGAGGLGREVAAMMIGSDTFEPAGFLDDSIPAGKVIHGLKVMGTAEQLRRMDVGQRLVVALGDPILKEQLVRRLASFNVTFQTIVHPGALLQDAQNIRIGDGCIIQAGVIFTTGITLGNHVLVNLNCTVGHDARIETCSSLMPGVNLAGNVSIGESVLIGSGVNVINSVSIGRRTRVGAGAVVIGDLPEGVLAVGVPAVIK